MRRIFAREDVSPPMVLNVEQGECVFFSEAGGGDAAGNEDAALVFECPGGETVLALADGMGGGRAGGEAAALAMGCLDAALEGLVEEGTLRHAIVDAFERANAGVLELGLGAGTTLVVAEISNGHVRTYHAGDSGAILMGQRGRIALETIPHSPTGYAVEAGLLARDEKHAHPERHLLSNCLGAVEMRIEIGPPVRVSARDTLLLASDGVLDNVRHDTLVELIRKGPLENGAAELQAAARATMRGQGEVVGHPDDSTALLYRPVGHARARVAHEESR